MGAVLRRLCFDPGRVLLGFDSIRDLGPEPAVQSKNAEQPGGPNRSSTGRGLVHSIFSKFLESNEFLDKRECKSANIEDESS